MKELLVNGMPCAVVPVTFVGVLIVPQMVPPLPLDGQA